MAYQVYTRKSFDKDLKKCIKRGFDRTKLNEVLRLLSETGTLPPQYKAHKLSGDYAGCWECHISGDWLLVWEQNDYELTLLFVRTGTHSDLF